MRKTLLLIALALPAMLCFSQNHKQVELEELERQRFKAMTTKDTAFLRKSLAEDLSYLHSNGLLEDKEQHIANIAAGRLIYKSMEPLEMKIRVHGRSAIVNGLVHVTGNLGEKQFDMQLLYTDVYLKRKGKWQLAAWQSLKYEGK